MSAWLAPETSSLSLTDPPPLEFGRSPSGPAMRQDVDMRARKWPQRAMARTEAALQDWPMGARTTGKVRVLLVDDLSDIRLVMRLLLEADGRAEVVGEAADGAEAVRLAGELHPDAVVLDLRMPGMDGVTALPLIRDAAPGTVVVALSALPVGPAADP